LFLDTWGSEAEELGWTVRDIVGPAFALTTLAWVLMGARVVCLAATTADLSDGRTFVRQLQEDCA
jgi:hypothetical protein